MSDDIQTAADAGQQVVLPQVSLEELEGILIAISTGQSPSEQLGSLQQSIAQRIIDQGGDEGAANSAAEAFASTLQDELFNGGADLLQAADYAQRSMGRSFETYDPSSSEVSATDALFSAIASGQGIEEAVERVVSEMGDETGVDGASDTVTQAFLDELQDSLSRGESPQQAVDNANNVAQSTSETLADATVPADPFLQALSSGGDNVGDAIQNAAQQSGGDANAFIDQLEASLAGGQEVGDALNTAGQTATEVSQMRTESQVELSAADRLAQSLASGDNVQETLQEAGGGDAFASTLENALANGAGTGDAMQQAGAAQQQQDTIAQQQSVPISAADQLAASLASGENVEQAMADAGVSGAGGDEMINQLASGADSGDAMQQAQAAQQSADSTAQQQSVPISAADQLAASLASGDNVDQALADAGVSGAGSDEMMNQLASGADAGEAMQEAAATQQSADATAQQQSVPADPAVQALAQGGDAVNDVDVSGAIADATGEVTPPSNEAAPTQTAEAAGETAGQATETATTETGSGETETQQTQSTETAEQTSAPAESTETAATTETTETTTTETTETAATTETTTTETTTTEGGGETELTATTETTEATSTEETTETGQTEEQTQTQTAENTEENTQAAGEETTEGSTENGATDGGVTEGIQTASTGENENTDTEQGQNQGEGDPNQGGPSEEELDQLAQQLNEEIDTAAGPGAGGGNQGGASGTRPNFQDSLNTNLFGGNTPAPTTTTTTGGGGGSSRPTRETRDNDTTTGGAGDDPIFVNTAPTANVDIDGGDENETLSINVIGNDTDPDGDDLTVTAASVDAGQGSVTFTDSNIEFDPGSDFNYLDNGDSVDVTITYTISDGAGGSDSSTVLVTVTGTGDDPTVDLGGSVVDPTTSEAVDNAAPGGAQIMANGNVDFVDLDADDTHTVTVAPVGGPTGAVVANITTQAAGGTGTVSWSYSVDEADFDSLAVGQQAVEQFEITITDSDGETAKQIVSVTITGTNDSPIASADTAAGDENETLTIDVLANDTDVDADDSAANFTVTNASVPAGQGSVSIDANNNVVFNPGSDFDNLDPSEQTTVTISYDMQDDSGATSSSSVTVTITGTNDAPVAVVDTDSVAENGTVLVDVLANDTDVDGDDGPANFTLTNVSVPAGQGSVTIEANQVRFDPGLDFEGLDDGDTQVVAVTYTFQDDSGEEATGTLNVTVNGSNDAPTLSVPAQNVASEDFEGGASGWSDNTTTDMSGTIPEVSEALGRFATGVTTQKTYSIQSGAEEVTIGFDFLRIDTWDNEDFSVLINGTVVATRSFSHGANNDDTPDAVFTPITDNSTSFARALTADQVFRGTITLDSDAIDALPDDGNGGKQLTLGFTSNLNQSLSDESWAIDNLSIIADGVAAGTGDEDTTIAISGISVDDVDGDSVSVTLNAADAATLAANANGGGATFSSTGASNMTISGSIADVNAALSTLTYAGVQNFNGASSIDVTVDDGTTTANRTYDVVVNAVNDAPTVSGPVAHGTQTEDDSAFDIQLLNNSSDVDGDDRDVDAGSVTIAGGDGREVAYTLDAETGALTIDPSQFGDLDDGEQQDYTVTYDITDGNGGTVSTSATFSITGANDAPTVTVAPGSTNALNLNGTNTSVDIPDEVVNNTGNGMIEAWVYFDGTPNGAIFTKQHDGVNSHAIFQVNNGTLSWKSHNGTPTLQSNTQLQADTWHHVAINYTWAGVQMYIDGVQVGADIGNWSILDDTGIADHNGGATIGAWPEDGGGQHMDGQIAEFRVWNVSRSQTDVQNNMGTALNGDEAGLQALYNFDGSIIDGGVVTDATGTYNGTSANATSGAANAGLAIGSTTAVGDEDNTIAVSNVTVDDVDGDGVTVTLTAGDGGTVSATQGAGGAVISSAGTGVMTISGSAADVNAALATMTYSPVANFYGNTSIAVAVNDGTTTTNSSVSITVNSVNDVPTVGGALAGGTHTEDASSFTISLLTGTSDADGDDLDTDSVAVTSSDSRTVNFSIDNETGVLTIDPSQFGDLDDGEQVTLSVTYNVVDGNGGSVANTASATITGANDAPTISTPVAVGSLGTEFVVNSTTAGAQAYTDIATFNDGSYVIVWGALNVDGDSAAVMGQRFDANHNKVGGEFQINTTTANEQNHPTVASHSDGTFTVTWHSYTQDGSEWGIYGQRYDSDGNKDGGEYQVNTTTNFNQYYPTILALPDGGEVITWSSWLQDGSDWGVYMQRYDADGNTVGGETQVNTHTSQGQHIWNYLGTPSAAYPDGSFILVWSSNLQDGSEWGVYGQRYDSDGNPDGGEFIVNTTTNSHQFTPSVAILENGNTIITWSAYLQDGSGWGVYKQTYDSNFNAVGGEVLVNSTTAGEQHYPDIVALDGGGYVIAWQDNGADGSNFGIFAQQYDENGNTVGGERQINDATANQQESVHLAATPGGGYVATYYSFGGDGDDWGIIARPVEGSGTIGDEDTAITVSGVSVGDVDGDSVTVTLTAADGGTVDANANGGGANVSNAGSGVMTISGSVADVNTALNSLTYTGASNFNGSSSVAISVNDGTTTVNNTVDVTVNAVADPIVMNTTDQSAAFTGAGTNGTDSSFSLASASSLNSFPTSAGTFELDIKTTDTGFPLLSYSDPTGGGTANELLIYYTSGGGLDVWMNDSRVLEDLNIGSLHDGEWHHVAVSFDNGAGTGSVFVDGIEMGTFTPNGTIETGGALVIGQDQDDHLGGYDTADGLIGNVDNVRIWNDVRTESEIADNAGNLVDSANEANLVYDWRFNDNASPSIDSKSGVAMTFQNSTTENDTGTTITEDFEGGATGWTNNTTETSSTTLTEVLGRFGSGDTTEKTFTLDAATGEARITFDFHALDSWDGETFTVQANGTTVASRTVSVDNPGADDANFTLTQSGSDYSGFTAGFGWTDQSYAVTIDLSAAQIAALPTDADGNKQLTLNFSSTLDQGVTDESWAIDNLVIESNGPSQEFSTAADTIVVDLLDGASGGDADIDVANLTISASDGRTVSYTLDAETGQLTIDPDQFDDLNANADSIALTVQYDATDGSNTTPVTAIYAVNGSDAPEITYTTGHDVVLTLDGVDDDMSIAHSDSLNFGPSDPITVEMWINPTDNTSHQTLISKNDSGQVDYATFRLHLTANGTLSVWNGSTVIESGVNAVAMDQWQHVSFTNDGTTTTIYVNGEQVAQGAHTLGNANTDAVIIGDDNQATRNFEGQIADVKIWDSSRTQDQIQDGMINPLSNPSSEANLVGYYNFEDGTGADQSGNDNHATLNGGAAAILDTGDKLVLGATQDGTTKTGNVDIDGSFSLEVFVNTTDANTSILSHEQSFYSQPNFQIATDVNGAVTFFMREGTDDSSSGNLKAYFGTTVINNGLDHHIAVTFNDDTDEVLVYVNGVLETMTANHEWGAAGTYSRTSSSDPHALRIGTNEKNDAGLRFEGEIGEIRVWDKTLTAEDVQNNMTSPVGQADDGLQHLWTFETGNLTDAVGGNTISLGSDTTIAVDELLRGSETIETGEGVPVSGQLVAESPAGNTITSWTVDTNPSSGALSTFNSATGDYTYQPNTGFSGADSFKVRVTDSAGNTRIETINIVVNDPPVFADHSNALALDGSSYASVADNAALDVTTTFTLEMWVKADAAGTLMSKDALGVDTTNAYNLALSTGSSGKLNLNYETNNQHPSVSASDALDVGAWHHVAATFNNGNVKLYVDGQEVGSETGVPTPTVNGNDLLIGRRGLNDDALQGQVDEVRIWNTAQDQTAIQANMNQELNGDETGLAGYWTFNEASGNAVDQTANGNDATLQGSAARADLVSVSISNNDVYKGLLLGKDPNSDDLSYSIKDGPDNGTLSLDGNKFVYDHDGSGQNDSFTVEISDGTDTITEQIDITVV